MLLDARQKLFFALGATFITCFLVGDIVGGKLVQGKLAGYEFTTTVGMIPFPVTFLLTDVLNEFYGKRAARFVTVVGFCMALLAFSLLFIAVAVPIAPFTHRADWNGVNEASFANVFLGSQRILAASLCAFLVSQFVDIGIFNYLKRLTGPRFLWIRATGSTAASQLIDTIVINFAAWTGTLGVDKILNIIVSAYGLKILIALGLTPLIYLCHSVLARGLGIHPLVLGDDGEPVLRHEPG